MIKKIAVVAPFVWLMAWVSPLRAQTVQPITQVNLAALLDTIAAQRQPTIINFWSTWCKPCIDEIPHFLEVAEKFRPTGLRLLLVSLDTKSMYKGGGLQRWVKQKGWQANMLWLNETNADKYCPAIDSGWSGVIPATLIVNHQKGYRFFIEEALSPSALMQQVSAALAGLEPTGQKNTPQP